MDIFRYEPVDLEGPAFRLLRLFKGGDTYIQCELFEAWLDGDSMIPYEALSYTWGNAENYEYIRINGRRLGVTKNLYQALYHLRLQDIDRILWVDAICIDQGNERERGHQVQQMGNIYSQAERVIFWLGQPTRETNVLMDSLQELQRESDERRYRDWKSSDERWAGLWRSIQPTLSHQHSGLLDQQRRGMMLLLGRPWFKRVWILQEVANSRRAVVCCGSKSVQAYFFALTPWLIGTKPEPHCQAVLDIMPGPSRKDSWWSQKQDLYTLLVKFGKSNASDERDMIYALLGLSPDASDTNILRPDYTKTTKQVIHDTILFLFDCESSLTFHTMAAFIRALSSLNTISLCHAAKSHQAHNPVAFLKELAGEATPVENPTLGKNVMELLLQQRGDEVKVTEEVVKAAAGNRRSGKDIMELLLQQRGDEVKVTGEVVKAAAENGESGKDIMELLLQQRGDEVKVTGEVVKAAAENGESGKDIMELLLQQRGDEVKVTEEVVRAAIRNVTVGKDIMELLLQQRGDEVKITEEVVNAVVGDSKSRKDVMELLLAHQEAKMKVPDGLSTELAQSFGETPATSF